MSLGQSEFREYRVVGRINLNEGKTDRGGNPLSPCWRDRVVEMENPNRRWTVQQEGEKFVVLEFDHFGCDQARRLGRFDTKAEAVAFVATLL